MRRILITGATSGIGLSIAKRLASQGYYLILACRNLHKAKNVQKELLIEFPKANIDVIVLDLADFESIRNFSKIVNCQYESIDVLINNAGVFSDKKAKTKDGYELSMGVNYLGQVLLTKLLLAVIKKGKEQRIIYISSRAALFGRIKIKENLFTKANKSIMAYSKSKLAILYYTISLAEELKKENITVNAVHPGEVATNIWKGDSLSMKIMGPINLKRYMSPDQASAICCEVAVSDKYKGVTGKFIEAEGVIEYNKRCLDKDLRNELIKMTYKIF